MISYLRFVDLAKKHEPTELRYFDGPLIVQRNHFIDEIASLDEAFDLLEAWPNDQRRYAYNQPPAKGVQ